MELKEMSVEELEARKAAIATEIDAPEADLDALGEEVRGINAELEERKATEAKKVEVRKAVAEGAGEVIRKFEKEERKNEMSDMEIRNSAQYIEAYANYVKTGDATECRALLTENIGNGGMVPVPEFVYGIVAKRLEDSKILSRVRRMTAGGNVKVGFEIAAPAAGVHEEGDDPINEEQLTLGIVTLVPWTFKKWVSISDEALDSMSGRAYLEYIYDEVARGIIKARENAVVAAILAAPATATATAPAVANKTVQTAGLADFVQARALLSSAAEDLVIICTPADYASYKALQMGANYGVDPFDGLPVFFSDAATSAIIGDLSGVLENLPKGDSIEFKYDDHTRMKQDLVDILGRQPSAIGVVGNKFFAKITNSGK